MSQSSVHQSTIPALLSKTPAINRTTRKAQNALVNRTVGLKPKQFEIYNDSIQSCTTSTNGAPPGLFKPTISATPANKNKLAKNLAVPSTRKKLGKPLEDKTNTIRKQKNVQHLSLAGGLDTKKSSTPESPTLKAETKAPVTANSLELSAPSPHHQAKKSASFRSEFSPPNTKLRLLYRTPITAKRAHRPPQPLFGSEPEDEDDEMLEEHASPIQSAFHIDLNLDNVPDVEFGPPSAIIEQVEYPDEDNQVDFSTFFGSLQNSQNHLISAGYPSATSTTRTMGNDLNEQIQRVMEEDGRKELWTREPECQMTTYEGDHMLDEIHLPPPPTRPTSKLTRQTRPPSTARQLRPTVSRSTVTSSRPTLSTRPPAASLHNRTQPSHGPSTRSSSKPSSIPPASKTSIHHPPMVTCFHHILENLVRQEQLLIHEDLAQDNLFSLQSEWDTGLDNFLLDL